MSILITSVLNCASDRLAISLLLSCSFSGALIFHLGRGFFFGGGREVVSVSLLRLSGRALGFTRKGQPTWLCCDAICGEGVREGTVQLAPLSAGFQSLPLLPTSKLGPSGADSQVGGLVYILGPCGSFQ